MSSLNTVVDLLKRNNKHIDDLQNARAAFHQAVNDVRNIEIEIAHAGDRHEVQRIAFQTGPTGVGAHVSLNQVHSIASATLTNARDKLVKTSLLVAQMLHTTEMDEEVPGEEEFLKKVRADINEYESQLLGQPIPQRLTPAIQVQYPPESPWD